MPSVRQDKVQVDVEINGQKAGESLRDIKRDIKALYSELANLVPGTQQWINKLDEIKGKTKLLEGANQAIKDISTTNKEAFRSFTKLGEGIVSAFNIANIIPWGNAQKSVAELAAGAQQAIAVALSVRAVAEGLVEGRVAARLILEKAAAIQPAIITVATQGLAAAQTFLQVQLGLSAVAARAFSIAIAATGIGAIVVAIGLAVVAFKEFTKVVDENAVAVEKENAHLKLLQDSLNFVNSLLDANTRAEKENLQAQLQLSEELGESVEKQFAIKERILALDKKSFEDGVARAKAETASILSKTAQLTEADNKRLDELQQFLAAENIKLNTFALQEQTLEVEKNKALEEERKKHHEKIKAIDELAAKPVDDGPLIIAAEETELKIIKTARTSAQIQKEINDQLAADKKQAWEETSEFLTNKEQELLESVLAFTTQLAASEIAVIRDKAHQGVITEQEAQKQISVIRKKQATLEKAAALFNIGINTSKAVAEINANPAVNLDVTQSLRATLTALVVAIGAAQAASVIAAPIPQFAKGGHTGKAAGIVHEDEWVSPKWMTEHPQYGAIINFLEGARVRGFGVGGFTSAPSISNSFSSFSSSMFDSSSIINSIERLNSTVSSQQRVIKAFVTYTDLTDTLDTGSAVKNEAKIS